MARRGVEIPDLREKGGVKNGEQQASDRRLFMQFLAFGDCPDAKELPAALAASQIDAALYEDVNDPKGVGVLALSEDPAVFPGALRELLNAEPFSALTFKPEYTMLGRTYAIGYEPDLDETLVGRPRRTALNPEWPWAIFYPLRRLGAFNQLDPSEQKSILAEHGGIGRAFGEGDYAHDIRLACFGLDKADNDFIVGLTGKELFPLSAVVQRMRSTVQTSQYMEKMGPFFVGRALWKAPV